MRRLATLGILLCNLTGAARAEQFWVAWEGNDFPENEGWERVHYGDDGPPAIRSLSNGVMTLDGLASTRIVDAYRMYRPINPQAGEEFVIHWRLQIDEVGNQNYPYDPGLSIYSDDGWDVLLVMGVDEVHSVLEQADFGFEAGVFHDWTFRTKDMRSYTLSVDRSVVYTGVFTQSGPVEWRLSWGDIVAGSNSLSDWDYFRFGIVPEPTSCISLLALLGFVAAQPSRRLGRKEP